MIRLMSAGVIILAVLFIAGCKGADNPSYLAAEDAIVTATFEQQAPSGILETGDEQIAVEIDDIFIEEDEYVEIGEMI